MIGVSTAGNGWAYVRFAPPTDMGSSGIVDYTIVASDGATQVVPASVKQPVKFSGLTSGMSYAFSVTARNSSGSGISSQLSNAVTPSALTCSTGGGCEIGQIGPGGGIVFYVAPTLFTSGLQCSNSCEYLEVAPTNWVADETIWSWNNRYQIEGTADGIGAGYANSLKANFSLTSNSCISAARRYVGGGKSDWYLPAPSEYVEIYRQFSVLPSGYTLSGVYKSSRDNLASTFWYFDANRGTTSGGGSKNSNSKARPIRAFMSG